MIKHRAVRAVACTLLAAAGCQQTDGTRQKRLADGPDITLDSIIQYQTIVGWEANSQSGEADFPNFPQYSDQLFDLAIDSLGITRIRLEAWSGIENTRSYWLDFQAGRMDYRTWRCHRFATINDNADPDSINWSGFHFDAMDTTVVRVVLPLVKRMQARGEKLYINLTYDSFILQCPTATYHHDNIAEYAEFALAVHDDLQGKGIGTHLMKRLIEIARDRGVRGFTGYVLADNSRMMNLFNQIGIPVESTLENGIYTVVIRFHGA